MFEAEKPTDTTSQPEPAPDAKAMRGRMYSPSPKPGRQLPKRRQEDTKSYGIEWTFLIAGLATYLATLGADMTKYESWSQMATPGFIGTHMGQLMGVIVAIVSAKRMKR